VETNLVQGRKVYWSLDWEKAREREKSLERRGARLLNRVGWGELDLSLGGGDLVWGRGFGMERPEVWKGGISRE
jgi:hypothetical protein